MLSRACSVAAILVCAACSPSAGPSFDAPQGDAGDAGDAAVDASWPEFPDATSDGAVEAAVACPSLPSPPTSSAIQLAPAYASLYQVYSLGPVPGAPSGTYLGGCTLLAGTTDTLLIGVDSEAASGSLYEVKVKRDACHHIVGFDGVATQVATAPYVDATLLYGPNNVLLFPMWSGSTLNEIGQLPFGGTSPVVNDTSAIGVGGGGPGSIGFVPPTVPAAAGELRVLTQNASTQDGYWYHVHYAPGGTQGTFVISNAQKILTLPRWPGGFAYVPAGSPGFTDASIIVAEWDFDSVATYSIDTEGDPVPTSRQDFFTAFPRPWGAYFEPETGDYFFLTWGAQGGDDVYVVSGFTKPPTPPTQPK